MKKLILSISILSLFFPSLAHASLWDEVQSQKPSTETHKSLWDEIEQSGQRSKTKIENKLEGIASWYAHRQTPGGSATNLFPKGTSLRVTNLDTGKSILTKITSTWTQKDTRRVIDLEKTAFKKIGDLSQGIIHVKIEALTKTSK